MRGRREPTTLHATLSPNVQISELGSYPQGIWEPTRPFTFLKIKFDIVLSAEEPSKMLAC